MYIIEWKSGNRLCTLIFMYCDLKNNMWVAWALQEILLNRKEIWCIRALPTNILRIGFKVPCVPDTPVSHQHVLNKQNVFWNFEGSWYTIKIELFVFEVKSIQTTKSKSSSCTRKKPSCELWPFYQALPASHFWWKTCFGIDLYANLISTKVSASHCKST